LAATTVADTSAMHLHRKGDREPKDRRRTHGAAKAIMRPDLWNFSGLSPQHRAVGYLPRGYALLPQLRAWENVVFALVRGLQRRHRR
jgi:ABC-type multidrug transport system ATPase subunit